MFNSQVAVLDFGSSKITVLVGNKSEKNLTNIVAKGMSDYAGFMDGEFIEPSSLQNSLLECIQIAEKTLKKRIKTLYVGVPAEFSYSVCEPMELFFPVQTKIKPLHVEKLFANKPSSLRSATHSIISESALYYTLDSGTKVENAVNETTTSLHALVSFVFVDNIFLNHVTNALEQIGVKNIEFISNSLAEGLYLLDKETRQNPCVLVDSGYITSSVVQIMHNGLTELKSFSLGGGHITSDLSELLKIPFYSAEQLKRKIVLTLDAKPSDYYEAIVDNKIRKFSAKTVNDIALARIDMLADTIKKSFAEFKIKPKAIAPIYLTGGGVSYIKGIRDYLTKYLGFEIVIVAPHPLMFNKPDLSSEISLFDIAVNVENS